MKKILCPIDFSKASLNGLNYAFETARRFNAELLLFHSVHFLPAKEVEKTIGSPEDIYLHEMDIKKKLEELCVKLEQLNSNQQVSLGYIAKYGLAADQILHLIKEQNIDFVILGTKGAVGIEKLLGTVAAEVALKAACPVMVIPENYSYREIKEIIYTIDLHGFEDSLVNYIMNFSKAFQANISFVTIKKEDEEDAEKIIKNGLNMLSKFPYKNISFYVIDKENVLEGINSFAETKQADLIVMATNKRNFIQRIFSKSKTKAEVFEAEIPLLALHKEKIYHTEL